MVSTSTILSECLFSVAMMVSKDLSITPISGLEVVLCGAGGGSVVAVRVVDLGSVVVVRVVDLDPALDLDLDLCVFEP